VSRQDAVQRYVRVASKRAPIRTRGGCHIHRGSLGPISRTAHTTINADTFETASTRQGDPLVIEGDPRLVAQLPPQSSHKKDIALFSVRKEEAADVDLRVPS
jgi:hypothetical protein